MLTVFSLKNLSKQITGVFRILPVSYVIPLPEIKSVRLSACGPFPMCHHYTNVLFPILSFCCGKKIIILGFKTFYLTFRNLTQLKCKAYESSFRGVCLYFTGSQPIREKRQIFATPAFSVPDSVELKITQE